jgi:hypothetical protein
MKTLISVLALLIMSFLLSACGSYDWHQKLTIEVETPDGLKSGSAVTAVSWWENRFFRDGPAVHSELTGEAVVVDLGKGKYLFALLRNPDGSGDMADLTMRIVANRNVVGWHISDVTSAKLLSGRINVPPKHFPMLVTFSNINDPRSVKQVDPNNLSTALGFGYSLRNINIEITNENVTIGEIDNVLSWLKKLRDRLIITKKQTAKNYLPIENVGSDYFISPFKLETK